ncbi:MAG TPA: SCE4755 family polysaccharide monooxygenase-like protein [Candidatus Binatia bacterium]|nr:SCE4755 family polysaccharide monooxygenase-like protein [Candidatus Binatia bacterium]
MSIDFDAARAVARSPDGEYPIVIPALPLVLGALLVAAVFPRSAVAHFTLHSPGSWRTQDFIGSPQKIGPCGNEGDVAATGVVTSFTPGQTITITLDETIYHPGHYRVALAVNDQSELPTNPLVAPGVTDCGSVDVIDPPQFPVLADGKLPHTSAFDDTVSFEVTLPSDVTCTRCTLQVLEFMSDHPAPCFYHHCADISIRAGATTDCTTDPQCDDGSPCTTDRCSAYGTCEHVDTVTSACDDGNACTRDRCAADAGCVSEATALTDVGAGFLGSVSVPECTADDVPAAIGKLFQQADGFLQRAAAPGAKASRFLNRARKRLRAASAKVDKAARRRLSAPCGTALGDVLDRAQADIACLAPSQ